MASEREPDHIDDEELSGATGGMNIAGVREELLVPVIGAEPETREHV